jgi:hypothetical protein
MTGTGGASNRRSSMKERAGVNGSPWHHLQTSWDGFGFRYEATSSAGSVSRGFVGRVSAPKRRRRYRSEMKGSEKLGKRARGALLTLVASSYRRAGHPSRSCCLQGTGSR